MKKIGLFILGILLVLCGCTSSLVPNPPEGFEIRDDLLFWINNESALIYRIELINCDTETILRKIVSLGDNLNELNIPEGDYMIKLQAIRNKKESIFTESIFYHQKDVLAVSKINGQMLINDVYIKWMGRTHYEEEKDVNLIFHSASGFEVHFIGSSINAILTATNTLSVAHRPYLVIVVDGDFENAQTICLSKALTNMTLVEGLDYGEHKLTVYKRSEAIDSHVGLKEIETDGKFIDRIIWQDRRIEFIAASSSTGYGNLSKEPKTTSNSDALKAFAFLTSKALNAEISIYAASGWGMKFSRWTKPMSLNMFDAYKKVEMFSSVDWDPLKYIPDVIVVNFGTNDWSYIALADNEIEKEARLQAFKDQYVNFIHYLRSLYQNVEIIILYGIMNEQSIYDATTDIYNRLVSDNKVHLLKASGDGGGSNSHPSLNSHTVIAETVINKIKEITNWK